jgi:hypothetical protein
VAHFVSGKVKEMRYHLSLIVATCDQSLRLFSGGQQVPAENSEAVAFGFSAFANTVQTLKDASHTVTGERLAWSKIEQMRHGTFMRHARNAATHDGNPVVSAWVDGRYFVPARIIRLDSDGKIVEIEAPREDVRTVCLEFTRDFCGVLREVFIRSVGAPALAGASFSMTELDEAIAESSVVPAFARQLFAENRDEIARNLATSTHDPVASAVSKLDEVVRFCDAILMN